MSLWAEVPESERATDAQIVEAWEGRSPHYRDLVRARLADPGPCRAAVKATGLAGKWLPCAAPVLSGEDLCAMHGGRVKEKAIPKWKIRAAQAWDEGWECARGSAWSTPSDNPYRA